MGFGNGRIAKVWEVNPKEKFYEIKLATSKKNKETDEYQQDFSAYVRFIGKANEKAKNLSGREMIRLLDTECTNTYKKEVQTTYTNYLCYDFEIYKNDTDNGATNNGGGTSSQPAVTTPNDDFNLPF